MWQHVETVAERRLFRVREAESPTGERNAFASGKQKARQASETLSRPGSRKHPTSTRSAFASGKQKTPDKYAKRLTNRTLLAILVFVNTSYTIIIID